MGSCFESVSLCPAAEDLYRSVTLVVNETTTDLKGVKLQRLMPDPANGDPDAKFFQRIQGLMNITSPTAGGKEAALLLHSQGVPASRYGAAAVMQATEVEAQITLVMRRRVNVLSVRVQGHLDVNSPASADQHPHLGCSIR